MKCVCIHVFEHTVHVCIHVCIQYLLRTSQNSLMKVAVGTEMSEQVSTLASVQQVFNGKPSHSSLYNTCVYVCYGLPLVVSIFRQC